MEALKAQIAAQKRRLAPTDDPAVKYMRRGERERQQTPRSASPVESPAPRPRDEHAEAPAELSASDRETIAWLREHGEPARLFGESEHARLERKRAAETRARRPTPPDAPQADKPPATSEESAPSSATDTTARVPAKLREGVGMNSVLDLKLMWTDQSRVYPIIYYTLKGLLADWAEALAQRSEKERESVQGRQLSAIHAQATENLKPLFKTLRRRALEPDILLHMAEIVHYMQLREYRKANDSYIQLSIGNAPWPLGIIGAKYVPTLTPASTSALLTKSWRMPPRWPTVRLADSRSAERRGQPKIYPESQTAHHFCTVPCTPPEADHSTPPTISASSWDDS